MSSFSSQEPSKADIDLILKRLRTLSCNKTCFDCSAKNPTWASVTYGVFICIDCSATHRSLGVHLSFVRSTQLDTNWTWIQLRSMQLGGNANATTFFEQHNCTTRDAQQKYNCRAAQLYREKLHANAVRAQKQFGDKVHIDEAGPKEPVREPREADFFQENTAVEAKLSTGPIHLVDSKLDTHIEDKSHEGPNVAAALSMSDVKDTSEPLKSNIIQAKRPLAKKAGLGAKKVNTDFNAIEKQMEEQERLKHEEIVQEQRTREETEKALDKQMASMKLAYDNLDRQRDKEEAKLKQTDPKKAQQLERLGMAAGNRSSGISHSALTDMQIIQQDGVYSSKPSMPKSRDFFDDFENGFSSSPLFSSKKSSASNDNKFGSDDMDFRGFGESKNSSKISTDWTIIDDKFESSQPKSSFASTLSTTNYSSSSSSSSSARNSNTNGSTSVVGESNSNINGGSGDASKRFVNAKSISSEQYFGNNVKQEFDRQSNLNRFENSKSISSEDYFGEGKTAASKKSYSSSSSSSSYQSSIQINPPDLSMLKQDFKDGVSKMAGKLSNMASNVMHQFQTAFWPRIVENCSLFGWPNIE